MRSALADPRVVGGAFRLRFEPTLARAAAHRMGHAPARRRCCACRTAIRRSSCAAAVLESLGGIPQVPILEDLDLVRALKRRGRLALPSAAGHHLRAPLSRGGSAAHDAAQLGGGGGLAARGAARADRGLGAPMTAAAPVRAPVRVALRRLRGYALRNRGYYAVWMASTLAYVAGFVAVPILVGWSVKAVVDGLGAQEVVRRVLWLALVTMVRAVVRYFSRTLVFNAAREIEYELRDDIFAHLERLPQSLLLPLAHRRHHEPLRERHRRGPAAARRGAAQPGADADPVRRRDRRDARRPTRKLALLVLIPYPVFILIARWFGRSIHHWSLATQEGLAEALATSSRRRSRASRW